MRGASVVGASIWDSGNRWITIHGTNRLVVRDCVGYQAAWATGSSSRRDRGRQHLRRQPRGPGDRGRAPLPGQVLAYDRQRGRRVLVGQQPQRLRQERRRGVRRLRLPVSRRRPPTDFDPVLSGSEGHDGRVALEDVRVQPFLRFDANEAHAQRRYGVNLGGRPAPGDVDPRGVDAVGPDSRHPLAIKGCGSGIATGPSPPSTPGLLAEGPRAGPFRIRLLQAELRPPGLSRA